MLAGTKKLLEIARHARLRFDPGLDSYSLPPWRQAAQTSYRVGIVGGGIAGLATAWLLDRLGHDVLVFEARDRVGGRIHTLGMPQDPGLCAEAGAARISDQHQLSLYWIRRFSLRLKPMYPPTGRLVRLDEHGRRVGRNVAGLSTHAVHHLVSGGKEWSSQFANPLLSARALISESLVAQNWYRIAGGNASLPAAFASGLAGRLRLATRVLGVDQTGDRVRIRCEPLSGIDSGDFDKVVLAVPLSTQRNISFLPPLPEIKRTVATTTRQQSSIRFFFQLRDRSWMKGGVNGYGSTAEGCEIWHPTYWERLRRSLLILYAQGQAAEMFVRLEPHQRNRQALSMLEKMFPGVESLCEYATSYCWDEDPWAGGAQSLIKRQENPRWNEAIGPEGRIHFAGEYTSGGWIDDALDSAHRVVGEICGLDR